MPCGGSIIRSSPSWSRNVERPRKGNAVRDLPDHRKRSHPKIPQPEGRPVTQYTYPLPPSNLFRPLFASRSRPISGAQYRTKYKRRYPGLPFSDCRNDRHCRSCGHRCYRRAHISAVGGSVRIIIFTGIKQIYVDCSLLLCHGLTVQEISIRDRRVPGAFLHSMTIPARV